MAAPAAPLHAGEVAVPGAPVDSAPYPGAVQEMDGQQIRSRVANRATVVAVVIGAVSLFIGLLGPLAIVLGLRARRRGGSPLAVLAVIAGSVSSLFLVLGIVHYLIAVLR